MNDNEYKYLEKTCLNLENYESKKEKIEEIHKKLTNEEIGLIIALGRVKNPFRMIGVKEVMDDLKISESAVYKTFRREDFPSINVGKFNQVMLLPYLIWKMNKKK